MAVSSAAPWGAMGRDGKVKASVRPYSSGYIASRFSRRSWETFQRQATGRVWNHPNVLCVPLSWRVLCQWLELRCSA